MKKSLRASVRRRGGSCGTVAPSPVTKSSPDLVEVKLAFGIPDGTGEARGVSQAASLRTLDGLDLAVGHTCHPTSGYGEFEATPLSVSPGQLDVSTDFMPVGVEYIHLPPCDPPNGFRRQHLRLMVDADGEMVGSGYGSTWVDARIEACALYRRSRIRCVSVSERKPG